MPETLDSSLIRHLILKGRFTSPNLQISDIGRSVVSWAVNGGFLSGHVDLHYDNALAEKITAVIWELIFEGVYTPGAGMQQPNLPFLRITEYGQKCFEAGELTAHDPDDYLKRLKAACPGIDAITLLYTREALESFRVGRFLATAVMIGVAAENILFRLVDCVHGALDTQLKQQKFQQDIRGKAK
jgi:hypothetical protein